MITIVGSRSLWPTVDVVSAVAAVMLSAPESESYGVRAAKDGGVSSGVELTVVKLCDRMHRTIRTFQPLGTGRASVFERDFRLAEASTRVIAFFPLTGFMTGGTAHVVKAAVDRGIDVEAYAVNENGETFLMGSDSAESVITSNPVFLKLYEGQSHDY